MVDSRLPRGFSVGERRLLALVEKLNKDPEIDGILVQLPLPKQIDENKVIAAIGYFGILCLLPLILKKDSPFAQFHGKQGLVLLIAFVLLWGVNVGALLISGTLVPLESQDRSRWDRRMIDEGVALLDAVVDALATQAWAALRARVPARSGRGPGRADADGVRGRGGSGALAGDRHRELRLLQRERPGPACRGEPAGRRRRAAGCGRHAGRVGNVGHEVGSHFVGDGAEGGPVGRPGYR